MLAVKALANTRQSIKRYHFHLALVVGLWLSSFSLASAQEIVRVCNKGDVEVFYASLGTHQQLLSASARIEGLYPIPPGDCRDVMPFGMSNVTVAFFHVDKTGKLGNVVYATEKGPRGALKKAGLDRICVKLGQFQDGIAQRQQSLRQFVQSWTPPCPPGLVSAETSFGAWGGSNFVYTMNITPSLDDLVKPLEEDKKSRNRTDPVKPLTEDNKSRTRDDELTIQTKTFDDGTKYEGQMRDGTPHGHGVMSSPDGGHYDGAWRSGSRDGQGMASWPDGRQFSGSWANNMPHRGTWTLPDGRVFKGQLVDDLPNGYGIMTWPDGREYEGNWKNGKPEGIERWKWPDGRTFRGRSKDPASEQWGTLTWPDGRKFYGPLKDFKPHGEGKVTLPDGSRFKSLWENGVLIKKLGGH